MTPPNKNDYINYRLEKAKALFGRNSYGACVNRLYYSVFYSASALLFLNDFDTKTHKGILVNLNLHFIKTEILPVKIGKILATLFNLRQKGDYDDFFEIDLQVVEPLLLDTAYFLETIGEYITQKRNNS